METDEKFHDPLGSNQPTETPMDFSLKKAESGSETENDSGKGAEAILSTDSIVSQVNTILRSMNLTEKHLLTVFDSVTEETLKVTIKKAGMPWNYLMPDDRRIFNKLAEWVKSHSDADLSVPVEPFAFEPVSLDKPQEPIKRKRGRPPGSKNGSRTSLTPKINNNNNNNQIRVIENGGVEKRKRGRPPKVKNEGMKREIKREASVSSQYVSSQVKSAVDELRQQVKVPRKQTIKNFMKKVQEDGTFENISQISEINVKKLMADVKEMLAQRNIQQEQLADIIGIPSNTLLRVMDDASWSTWSMANNFRRAVFWKLQQWVDHGSDQEVDLPLCNENSNDEQMKPFVDTLIDDENVVSRPGSSNDNEKHFLSPSLLRKDEERTVESIDDIPEYSSMEPYFKEDMREGELVWPHPSGLSCLSPDDVLIDDVVKIGNRKKIYVKSSRLTILSEHRYGVVGPSGCGKSALLRLIGSKKNSLNISKNLSVLYVDQQIGMVENPQNVGPSNKRVIEILRQKYFSTMSNTDIMRLPDAEDLQGMCDFQDAWCGSAEAKVREILDGLGLTRDTQNSLLRDVPLRVRTRLALAKALCCEPTILILDEPTTFLDVDGVLFLQSYLQSKYSYTPSCHYFFLFS